jgi:hypothetical protein
MSTGGDQQAVLDEIIAGPCVCSMRATWLRGTWAPFEAVTRLDPSASGSDRYCGAYRTRTGNRRRPSIVVVRTVSPTAVSMIC